MWHIPLFTVLQNYTLEALPRYMPSYTIHANVIAINEALKKIWKSLQSFLQISLVVMVHPIESWNLSMGRFTQCFSFYPLWKEKWKEKCCVNPP